MAIITSQGLHRIGMGEYGDGCSPRQACDLSSLPVAVIFNTRSKLHCAQESNPTSPNLLKNRPLFGIHNATDCIRRGLFRDSSCVGCH